MLPMFRYLGSGGKEVAAVWADAGLSFNLLRIGALEFRGSGAAGELGPLWSIVRQERMGTTAQQRRQKFR